MKPNELRIGNWVKYKSVHNVILTAQDFCQIEEDIEDDKIHPIPLTEEWLEKFGFKKVEHEMDDYLCIEYIKDLDEWSRMEIQDDMSFGIYDKIGRECVAFENDIIDSVHRLQNIWFALTGKELEIK